MAETLGILCDKLTIVKLKEYHSIDKKRLSALKKQAQQLQDEIDTYVKDATKGKIPVNKLTFASHKVFKKKGNKTKKVADTLAKVFSQLADVNINLWHEVEKGYDIKKLGTNDKDKLINSLAVLNLQRNNCIDEIDILFQKLIKNKK